MERSVAVEATIDACQYTRTGGGSATLLEKVVQNKNIESPLGISQQSACYTLFPNALSASGRQQQKGLSGGKYS